MNLKEIFSSRLRVVVQGCQLRGLYQASLWASEQLLGLESVDGSENAGKQDSTSMVDVFSIEEMVSNKEIPAIMMSMPLLAQGQYHRCAHNIRRSSQGVPQLSKLSLFLYAYSQYMAGEKQRSQVESMQKDNGESLDAANDGHKGNNKKDVQHSPPRLVLNPHLPDLYKELLPYYTAGKMDGYLLYIFAVICKDLFKSYGRDFLTTLTKAQGETTGVVDPGIIFQQSLTLNPWNWSCWLEFEQYLLNPLLIPSSVTGTATGSETAAIPSWEEMMQYASYGNKQAMDSIDRQCGRAMYAFFIAHVHIERYRGDLALQAMEKLSLLFPSSLYLYAHIAVAFYLQRQYPLAITYFDSIQQLDPYRIEHLDTYSNILYVQEDILELSSLAYRLCAVGSTHLLTKYPYTNNNNNSTNTNSNNNSLCLMHTPEAYAILGNYYSCKGRHSQAIRCFSQALYLNPALISAYTLMGHEYMELRNTSSAVACYRIAVQKNPRDFRAWYGLGQTYEMLHLYTYAIYYYRIACHLKHLDARMWSALGQCLLKLVLRKQAKACYERAVKCGDEEGIATRDLARLYREDAETNLAAECYYYYLHATSLYQEYPPWLPRPMKGQQQLQEDGEEEKQQGGVEGEEEDGGGERVLPGSLGDFITSILTATSAGNQQSSLDTYRVNWMDVYHQQQGGAAAVTVAMTPVPILDPDHAEAFLYLIHYCSMEYTRYQQLMKETAEQDPEQQQFAYAYRIAMEYFCYRLLSYVGPEGEEARTILGSIYRDQGAAAQQAVAPTTTTTATATRTDVGSPPSATRRRGYGSSGTNQSLGSQGSIGSSGGRRGSSHRRWSRSGMGLPAATNLVTMSPSGSAGAGGGGSNSMQWTPSQGEGEEQQMMVLDMLDTSGIHHLADTSVASGFLPPPRRGNRGGGGGGVNYRMSMESIPGISRIMGEEDMEDIDLAMLEEEEEDGDDADMQEG